MSKVTRLVHKEMNRRRRIVENPGVNLNGIFVGHKQVEELTEQLPTKFEKQQDEQTLPTNWESEFIEWDNKGHFNASQRDIINWFKGKFVT